MSFDAEGWNTTNTYFFDLAKKMEQLIRCSQPDRHYDVIVDIGIGSGNITETVTKSLSHNKIYGIDIDSNMIEFARENSRNKSIEYVLADLSGHWNSLSPAIKGLESNVSLIVSNMCINLMREKTTFVQNVKRLLATNEQAYFTFPIFPEITRKLSQDQRQMYERHVKVPDTDGQLMVWLDIFEANGFQVTHKEVEDAVWTVQSQNLLAIKQFWPLILDTWTQEIRYSDIPEDIKQKLTSLSLDALINWKKREVNWDVLNQIKRGSYGQNVECNWKIVYLACKSIDI